MRELLEKAVKAGASDLHLTTGAPPFLRVNGEIILMDAEPLSPLHTKRLIYGILNENQRQKIEKDLELCFSMNLSELGYFRVNVYYQRGNIEAAVRIGMLEMKSFEELGLPEVLMDMVRRPHGLLLITGPTGQGKTTTFNALIDFINRERRCKIITVEDPVEYVHRNIRSIVVQQELNTDTKSFHRALIHILRQDPDMIGVGEMRDLETISATMTAAETGHLVIATLHTNDCTQTMHRIVDVFPPHQQEQVRVQLAASLVGIINQKLLPRVDKKGRVLAYESLTATDAVRNLIRENKLQHVYSTIMTGREFGMLTMDETIKNFYQKGIISYDTARSNLRDPRAIETKPRVQR
jgi:twitching motility protein PilT